MNSKSQRTPLVREKIRKEPKGLWPSCQSHLVCAGVHESLLQTLLWHRHMPGWLSHGTVRLVIHSIDKTLHSSSHTTSLLFLCCHIKDASITAKLKSQEAVKPRHKQEKQEKRDNSRHEVKTQLLRSKAENGF